MEVELVVSDHHRLLDFADLGDQQLVVIFRCFWILLFVETFWPIERILGENGIWFSFY